jgi:hypothetical protein
MMLKFMKQVGPLVAALVLGITGVWGYYVLKDDINQSPNVVEMPTPELEQNNTLTVACVFSSVPGWLVGYSDGGDTPLDILGYQHVDAGMNENVSITLDPENLTEIIYLVLHEDTGIFGEFDYPAEDPPQRADDDSLIMAAFSRSVLESQSTAQMAVGARTGFSLDTGCDVTMVASGRSGTSFIVLDPNSEDGGLLPDSTINTSFFDQNPAGLPSGGTGDGGTDTVDDGTSDGTGGDGTGDGTGDGSGDSSDPLLGVDLDSNLTGGDGALLNVDGSANTGDNGGLDVNVTGDGGNGDGLDLSADANNDVGSALDLNVDASTGGGDGSDLSVSGDTGAGPGVDASAGGGDGGGISVDTDGDGSGDAGVSVGSDGSIDVNDGGLGLFN